MSPIEMSLGQAVVETFGVACDDGDPNERTGADAASDLASVFPRVDHGSSTYGARIGNDFPRLRLVKPALRATACRAASGPAHRLGFHARM